MANMPDCPELLEPRNKMATNPGWLDSGVQRTRPQTRIRGVTN